MAELRQTVEYGKWFEELRDIGAKSRVLARIRRLALGNPGDVKRLSGGICEMRIDYATE